MDLVQGEVAMRKLILLLTFACVISSLAGCITDSDLPPGSSARPPVGFDTEEISVEGYHMVLIPGGSIEYYDMPTSSFITEELEPFLIDKYEVTTTQYVEFLNTIGRNGENGIQWYDPDTTDRNYRELISFDDGKWVVKEGFENYAIIYITWYGARAFCDWRGGELPTKAQYFLSAQGVDDRPYPWGFEKPACKHYQRPGCENFSLEVGAYPEGQSPYGVFDLGGGVREWSSTFAEDYQFGQIEEGIVNFLYGYSWASIDIKPQVTIGFYADPLHASFTSGFRCVMNLEDEN